MQKTKPIFKKRFSFSFLALFLIVFSLIFQSAIFAVPTQISVSDSSIADWLGVSAFNDSYGDVSGVGPNDLVKLWVTSDANNIYCRWDVILSGSKAKVTSAAYSLTLNSQHNTGITRPVVEARAYVAFNSQGAVSTIAIATATKTITLPVTYAEQISTGVAKTLVSIEAMFPFSSFNSNSMTVNPLGPTSLFPLWGEALSSGSFNSNVKDTIPDTGYLDYDAATSICIPKGTGPVANITLAAINNNVVPSTVVDYVVTIKNVGDSTGNPNLLFNSVQWTLPAGFTYVSGSTTGLVTANPTGTTGTLTWPISGGSLAPGASANIYFKATAAGTNGPYYSSAVVVATTPNITYNTGDGAVVNIDPIYVKPSVPLNLTANGTTQTTTNLTWSASNNAVAYDIYDNNIKIATNITGTSYTLTGLEAGSTHIYTVKGISAVGIESNASNTANVTTIAPYLVAINDLMTKDNTPAITGTTTAPDGSSISVVINGNTYTANVSGGMWSANVTNTLVDGTYTATAHVLNAIGNTANGTITIDTVAPTITVVSMETNDKTPTIRGTTNATDGSIVTITINSTQYTGTVIDGLWAITPTSNLNEGSYNVTANVTDAVGNTGTASGTVTINQIVLSSNTNLANLTTNAGSISPTFTSSTTDYTLSVARNISSITITPTAEDSKSIIRVEGIIVSSGTASSSISLNEGTNNLTVRVAAEDGNIKFYNLTVNRAISVIGVTLDKSAVSIYQSHDTTLIPTINPTNAEDKSVTWSSSDETIATVDANGLVTGVAPGTAVITVTTIDGGKTATCTVTVIKPEVTVTIKDGNKLNVNIRGWISNYKYQIWTYQTVTSDIFLNVTPNVRVDQWILSSMYAAASAAIQEEDGSISYVIDLPQNTPDGNYVVSVKIQDENGNFIGELKDTYTPENIGIVMISKVLVDGKATYSNETKEIKAGASVSLQIVGINSDSYSVTVNGVTAFAYSPDNTITWDMSDKQPGKYALVFYAKNTSTGSSFRKTVVFTLYSKNPLLKYGIIDSLSATGQYSTNQYSVTLEPQMLNGESFYFTIGESGRTPIFRSDMLSIGSNYEKIFTSNMYGIYSVYGYVKRDASDSYDDGIFTTITNPRDGSGSISMNLYADNANINTAGTISVAKNTPVVFRAESTIRALAQENIQYSFWRYDATGYVLVKDWSSSNSLDWTPARPGAYTIQIRAKGVDAGSYEIVKSINVNTTVEEIAQGVDISINQADLNANAQARVPIIINANATATGDEPLLYKFYAYDDNLGTMLLQEFSPIQSCEWIPRKAGTYKISVAVKNERSFGKYDAIESYTVTVR